MLAPLSRSSEKDVFIPDMQVLLMEPPTIAGAVVGSILNKARAYNTHQCVNCLAQVLPEYVITILLVLVLGATTYKTFKNGEHLSIASLNFRASCAAYSTILKAHRTNKFVILSISPRAQLIPLRLPKLSFRPAPLKCLNGHNRPGPA